MPPKKRNPYVAHMLFDMDDTQAIDNKAMTSTGECDRIRRMTWRTATPGEALDHRMQLALSKELMARVRRLAGVKGFSASEMIRQLIREGIERAEAESAD